MLQRQARPKRKRIINLLSTITTESKDCSNKNLYKVLNKVISKLSSLLLDIKYTRIGKALLNSIPVLSIFVLLGIMGYATIAISFGEIDGEVYAADTGSSSSLIIDNGEFVDNTTTEGNIMYSSHEVRVAASNIIGYALSITGPAYMTNGDTTISQANYETLSNMRENTWGYAWDSTATDNSDMVFCPFNDNAQALPVYGVDISNYTIDFTRKLIFAAKFSDDATNGHYKANVKLNLTVTPKTITTYNYSVTYNANGGNGTAPTMQIAESSNTSYSFNAANQGALFISGYTLEGWSESYWSTSATYKAGDVISLTSDNPSKVLYAIWKLADFPSTLTTMQGMTPEICASVATGTSKTLTDTRGNTPYTVRKLTDGNCWMTENLKLNLRSYTLTSTNSDVSSNWAGTNATNVTSASGWLSDDNGNNRAQYALNGLGGVGYNSDYGYYYSWCAATANTSGNSGTCKNYTSGDAPSSICPKGWKLPSTGDFSVLYYKHTADTWSSVNGINGHWLGAATITAGGAFFLANGFINGEIYGAGTLGGCWTRTVLNNSNAYNFYMNATYIPPIINYDRFYGYPVRCVAYSS